MRRLLLVRHGETEGNVLKELDSRPPGRPLNATGHAQAAALAARLTDVDAPVVYASTATRAQQTAAPLAAALGVPVVVVDDVHEVFCGDVEGRSDKASRALFDDTYAAWWRGELHARLPGGESAHDLRARYLPALEKLMAGATGDIVLVSHGAAIRLAAAALVGDPAQTKYLQNTAVVELHPDPWRIASWGG